MCGVRRALPVSQVRTNENGLSVTCVCVRVCVYAAYGDGGVTDRGCADGCSMEGAVSVPLSKEQLQTLGLQQDKVCVCWGRR